MTIASAPTVPQYLLSREELLAVLNVLETNYVFGLEPNPDGPETPEQQARAVSQAERALRARELARLTAEGHLTVQRALLEAVSACAYPLKTLTLHSFATNGSAVQAFGHLREGMHVFRATPEAGLHLLALYADKTAWIERLLAEANCAQLAGATTMPVALKGATLRQAREAALKDVAAAQTALSSNGLSATDAGWLAQALAATAHLTIFNVVLPMAGDQLSKQELTVLQAPSGSWLLSEPANAPEKDTYTLAPITTAQLKEMLVAAL